MQIVVVTLAVAVVAIGCGEPGTGESDWSNQKLPLDGTESVTYTTLPEWTGPHESSPEGASCDPFAPYTAEAPADGSFIQLIEDYRTQTLAEPIVTADLQVSASGSDVKGHESGQLTATAANATVWATPTHNALPERVQASPSGKLVSAWRNQWLHHELFNAVFIQRWYVLGLDAATGAELWAAGPTRGGQLVAVDDTTTIIYVGQPDWSPAMLYALNVADGTLRWSKRICGVESVAVAAGIVYTHHTPHKYRTEPAATYAYDEGSGVPIQAPLPAG